MYYVLVSCLFTTVKFLEKEKLFSIDKDWQKQQKLKIHISNRAQLKLASLKSKWVAGVQHDKTLGHSVSVF